MKGNFIQLQIHEVCYAKERGQAFLTLFAQKTLMNSQRNKMALSFQQLLNEQRVLSMPGLSYFFVLLRDFYFGSFNIRPLDGKSMELCEKLLRREVGICCIQEVRWRGMGSKFVGSLGGRFKLWWSGNEDMIGVSISESFYFSQRLFLFQGKKVVRIVCAYAPQCGRLMSEKEKFYEEMARGCEVENANKILICLGDFNGHIGKEVDGFEGVYGSYGIGKRNVESRLLLEFFC